MPAVRVIRAGMLTTVQDLGRWGHQGSGVPVAGPMDLYSHRLANRLVGNPDEAAALEITMAGPELEAIGPIVCAVAGARFDLTIGVRAAPEGTAFEVPGGVRLRFGPRTAGTRATLALRGGLDVPPVFGSRATSLVARMGPFGGRAIAAGDVLPVGALHGSEPRAATAYALGLPRGGARLRAIPGPDDDRFPAESVARFFGGRYLITTSANRMGYRLDGPPVLHTVGTMLSEATPIGSVQVPGSGQPILLMADRQTTGGYPRIATVITADLPLAAQLGPGDWIEFTQCTRADARAALARQEARLAGRLDPASRAPRA